MQLHYDEATERFRAGFVEWLDANRPSNAEMQEDPPRNTAHAPGWARRWQRRLFDAGWLVPGWPPELGGRNATAVQQMVYFEELARDGVPRTTNPQGLSIIAPSILEFGSETLRENYGLPILLGEKTACLGMSEPEAGSDLASLSTRANLVGDNFRITGQKIWTSGASDADFCFCFTRTDPSAPKHRGISVIIVDMDTPGVTARPLKHLVGDESPDFAEVFFDDVVVPRTNLVGEMNEGWVVGRSSLSHERVMMWVESSSMLDGIISGLTTQINGTDADQTAHAYDYSVHDELAQLYVHAQAVRLLGYRGLAKFVRGNVSPEQSILKLLASETCRHLNLLGAEMSGAWGQDMSDPAPAPKVRLDGSEPAWMDRYFGSFGATIAGGASEIQRNIIAERILGLPR